MNNSYFSPRYAPIVGMIVGAILAIRMSAPEHNLLILWSTCIGIGGLGGLVVFLLDTKPSTQTNKRSSSVVGRFLAAAGILLAIIPILGLVLCAVSFLANWKARDWAWKLSIVGLFIAILSTVIICAGLDNGYVDDKLEEFFLNL